MGIYSKTYTADHKRLYQLTQVFVNVDDEIRFADPDYKTDSLVAAREEAAEAVIAHLNQMCKTTDSM